MINRIISLDEKKASFETFIIDENISSKKKKKRPAIIICPGGAYIKHSHRESEPIALYFNGLGFHSFILRYPINEDNSQYPHPLLSLFQSLKIIRGNAEKWFVDTQRIYVVGFSAGGHVAGLFANNWNNSKLKNKAGVNEIPKVKGVIMAYPLIKTSYDVGNNPLNQQAFKSMYGSLLPSIAQVDQINLTKMVSNESLPQFIWCCSDDPVLDSADTIEYVNFLQKKHINVEFHMFNLGAHGGALGNFATADTENEDYFNPFSAWTTLLVNWMKTL